MKAQLTAKEQERVETVETLHGMETRCISMEARLEEKFEDFDKVKVAYEKLEKEQKRSERKAAEKDKAFYDKCNRLWELCKNCYDKWGGGAKPKDPCWELGEFDPFFGWLCRRYEDLSMVI